MYVIATITQKSTRALPTKRLSDSDVLQLCIIIRLLLARLMGQHYFARWRLSSSSVTLPAGGPAGRRARVRSARRRPGAWAVGRPKLHDWPVWLRPVSRLIPCFNKSVIFPYCPTETYTGRVVCCPLVSHVEYAPRALLRLEKRRDRQTDRQTDLR